MMDVFLIIYTCCIFWGVLFVADFIVSKNNKKREEKWGTIQETNKMLILSHLSSLKNTVNVNGEEYNILYTIEDVIYCSNGCSNEDKIFQLSVINGEIEYIEINIQQNKYIIQYNTQLKDILENGLVVNGEICELQTTGFPYIQVNTSNGNKLRLKMKYRPYKGGLKVYWEVIHNDRLINIIFVIILTCIIFAFFTKK